MATIDFILSQRRRRRQTTPTPTPTPQTPTPTPSVTPEPTVTPTRLPNIPVDLAWNLERREPQSGVDELLSNTLRGAAQYKRGEQSGQQLAQSTQQYVSNALGLLGESMSDYAQSQEQLGQLAQEQEDRNRIQEADQEIEQKQRLKELVDAFSPAQANVGLAQALASRPDVPTEEIFDRARLIEGGQNVRNFYRAMQDVPLDRQRKLGVLNTALIKSSLTSQDLLEMIHLTDTGDYETLAEKFTRDQRLKAGEAVNAASRTEIPAPEFKEIDLETGEVTERLQAARVEEIPSGIFLTPEDVKPSKGFPDPFDVARNAAEQIPFIGELVKKVPEIPSPADALGFSFKIAGEYEETEVKPLAAQMWKIMSTPPTEDGGYLNLRKASDPRNVQEFENLPIASQIALEIVFDPANALPAVGFGNDWVKLFRVIGRVGNAIGRRTIPESLKPAVRAIFKGADLTKPLTDEQIAVRELLEVPGRPSEVEELRAAAEGLVVPGQEPVARPLEEVRAGLEVPGVPEEAVLEVPGRVEPGVPEELISTELEGIQIDKFGRRAKVVEAVPEAAPARVAEAVPEEAAPIPTRAETTEVREAQAAKTRRIEAENAFKRAKAQKPEEVSASRQVTEAEDALTRAREARADLDEVAARTTVQKQNLAARVRRADRLIKTKDKALERSRTINYNKAVRTAENVLNETKLAESKANRMLQRTATARAKTQKAIAAREAKAQVAPTQKVVVTLAEHRARASLAGTPELAGHALRIRDQIRAAIRLAPARAEVIREVQRKKTGQLAIALRGAKTTKELLSARGVTKGAVEFPDFKIPEALRATPEERFQIESAVREYFLARGRPRDGDNAIHALDKIFPDEQGNAHLLKLMPFERELLAQAFGPELMVDLAKKLPVDIGEEIVSGINVSRLIMTGLWDVSFGLRQAAMAVPNRPGIWGKNMARYFNTFVSADAYAELRRSILDDPWFGLSQATGEKEGAKKLFLPVIESAGPLGEVAEEALLGLSERTYVGRFVSQIPGAKQTNRSANAFISSLRMDTFKNLTSKLIPRSDRARFLAASAKEQVDLARSLVGEDLLNQLRAFVTETTGRGTLGPLNKYSTLLNALFFAPKFVAGKVTPLRFAVTGKNWAMRRIVIEEYVRFLGTWGTIAGAIYAANKAGLTDMTVELSPISTDHGKIKIGPTRIDIAGGMQPLIRYSAQLISGKSKTATGDTVDIDVMDTAFRFVQSKLSPPAQVVLSTATGETFIGEEYNFQRFLQNNFVPLFIQDIIEGFQEGGAAGGILGMWGWVGLGVQTYETDSEKTAAIILDEFEQGNIGRLENGELNPEYDKEDFPTTLGEVGKASPKDRAFINEKYADSDLFKEREVRTQRTLDDLSRSELAALGSDLSDSVGDQVQAKVEDLAQQYRSSAARDRGEVFRNGVSDALTAQRGARGLINEFLQDRGVELGERPEEPGPRQDMFDYFSIFNKYPNADTNPDEADKMFNELDQFMESIGPDRKAEIEAGTGLRFSQIPEYNQLREDRKTLRDSGFFDRSDNAWSQLQGRFTFLKSFKDIDAYKEARFEYLVRTIGRARAGVQLDRDPNILRFNNLMKLSLIDWRFNNPDLIPIADKWGYRKLAATDIPLIEEGETGRPRGPIGPVSPVGPLGQ